MTKYFQKINPIGFERIGFDGLFLRFEFQINGIYKNQYIKKS